MRPEGFFVNSFGGVNVIARPNFKARITSGALMKAGSGADATECPVDACFLSKFDRNSSLAKRDRLPEE